MVWTGHICDIGVFVVGNSDQYGLYLFPFLEMHNIFLLGNKYFLYKSAVAHTWNIHEKKEACSLLMRIKEAGKYGLGIRMWCTQSKLVLLSSERKGPLSWTPSTVVCISPPLLRALLQPHQPYYFWTHNAGLTLYECGHRNLYCDRNSDRQVSCGQT
jgi:hypothetical protein